MITGDNKLTAAAIAAEAGVDTNTTTNGIAWWQAKDSDITSASDISSSVPSGINLILSGLGGFPGVATYNGNLDLGSGILSSTLWLAKTQARGDK